MKEGRTLADLSAELQRQALAKRDFVADTRNLVMLNGQEIVLRRGVPDDDPSGGSFELTPLAHDQISSFLDIPGRYYSRLRHDLPRLLDHNVNTLFAEEGTDRMVRTMDGRARAFLSNRYRRLDHNELMEVLMPVLAEIPDVAFPSMDVTDTRLYIKAVAPRLQAEVKTGDVVQAGVVITNSEVGVGSLAIQTMIFRLVCRNGAIMGDAVRRHHVGRSIDADEGSYEIFKDDTLRADDHAFFLKVRDATADAVSEARFQRVVQRFRDATTTAPIEDVARGVRELGKRWPFTDAESGSILTHLAAGGDLTMYGVIQAVTRTAADVESYDRSFELERIGGRILDLAPSEWRQIAAAV